MKSIDRARPNWIARGYFRLAERLYDDLAWAYDPVSRLISLGQCGTVRNWALDYLAGPRVLELAFGTGELLREIASRNIAVFGLEWSMPMHRVTANKLSKQGLSVSRVRAKAQQIPFEDDCFDTVVTTFPAGFIFDPATWREVSRILRKPSAPTEARGGRFIVIGICFESPGGPNLQLVRLLYGLPMEALIDRLKQLGRSVDLDVRVITRRHMALDIPVVIAETISRI